MEEKIDLIIDLLTRIEENTRKPVKREIKQKEYNFSGVNQVIEYLNEVCSRNFKATGQNLELIDARLKENDIKILKRVIKDKHAEWFHDIKMCKHLNPSTLFRKSNFDRYKANLESVIEIMPCKLCKEYDGTLYSPVGGSRFCDCQYGQLKKREYKQ